MNASANERSGFEARSVPAELKARRQWVGFKIIPVPGAKPKKIPVKVDAPNVKAKCDDASTWDAFERAVKGLADDAYNAVGYALGGDDVGIDLDGERWVTDEGELTEEAQAVVDRFGSYAEWSISGKGLHILLRGYLSRGRRDEGAGAEVYSSGRFFVMTGRRLDGTPADLQHNQEALDWFVGRYLKPVAEVNHADDCGEGNDICLSANSEDSAYSADSVNDVIAMTLPERMGQRNARLLDLARGLKLNCRIASATKAKIHVREWHRRALPKIGTKNFDESWADFCRAWDTAAIPLGAAVVQDALQKAWSALPPIAQDYETPAIRLLVGLCWHLAAYHPERRFFLSTHLAGEVLEVSAMAAWKWLKMLCTDGVLQVGECGNEYRATRYRWIAPDEIATDRD